MVGRRLAPMLFALQLAACAPNLDDDLSRVEGMRLLAVAANAPEVAPGETAEFEALVVDEHGPVEHVPLRWAFCVERKPLAELGPVSQGCLSSSGPQFVELGEGATVEGRIPKGSVVLADGSAKVVDACQLFGPQLPPSSTGGRPVDPDPSGGYYQPLRVSLLTGRRESSVGLAQVRIACPPSGLNQEQNAVHTHAYRRNSTPRPEKVEIRRNGVLLEATDPIVQVERGDELDFELAFPICAASPACDSAPCNETNLSEQCPIECMDGNVCGGAERYAWLNPVTKATQIRRETLEVAWFDTAGAWLEPRTNVNAVEEGTRTRNQWQADALGVHWLWIVIRDDRGGTSWLSEQVDVREP